MKFLWCIILCLPAIFAKIDVPSYVKICKRDKRIHDCLKENFEIARPHLKKGIPKLQIPSLDPLKIDQVAINGNSFKIKCTEFSARGLDSFVLHDVRTDFVNETFFIELSFPALELGGKYNVKGQILLFQLDGSGPLYINITDVHAKVLMDGTVFQKGGKDYVRYDKTHVTLNKLTKAHVHFGDLFANNPQLTTQYNEAINSNIEQFLDALQPLIEETISELTQSIVQRMFLKYSLDDLFPKV